MNKNPLQDNVETASTGFTEYTYQEQLERDWKPNLTEVFLALIMRKKMKMFTQSIRTSLSNVCVMGKS